MREILCDGVLLKQSDYLKKYNSRHFALIKSRDPTPTVEEGEGGASTASGMKRARLDFIYFHDTDAIGKFKRTLYCHRPTYKESVNFLFIFIFFLIG